MVHSGDRGDIVLSSATSCPRVLVVVLLPPKSRQARAQGQLGSIHHASLADRTGPGRAGSCRVGSDRVGPDWTGPDRTRKDKTGPDWADSGRTRSGRTRPDRTGSGRVGSDRTGPGRDGHLSGRWSTTSARDVAN